MFVLFCILYVLVHDIGQDKSRTASEEDSNDSSVENKFRNRQCKDCQEHIIEEEDDNEFDLDWSRLGNPSTESPRVKKAKRKLKKIFNAKVGIF